MTRDRARLASPGRLPAVASHEHGRAGGAPCERHRGRERRPQSKAQEAAEEVAGDRTGAGELRTRRRAAGRRATHARSGASPPAVETTTRQRRTATTTSAAFRHPIFAGRRRRLERRVFAGRCRLAARCEPSVQSQATMVVEKATHTHAHTHTHSRAHTHTLHTRTTHTHTRAHARTHIDASAYKYIQHTTSEVAHKAAFEEKRTWVDPQLRP